MSVGSVIRISNGLGCRIFYVDSELNSKTSDTDTDKCKNRTHIRKVFVSTDPKICCTVPNKNFASSCPTRPKPGALESKLNLQSFLLGRYTANASSPLRRLLSTELRLLRVFAPRKSDPLLKRSRYGSPPLARHIAPPLQDFHRGRGRSEGGYLGRLRRDRDAYIPVTLVLGGNGRNPIQPALDHRWVITNPGKNF